MAVNHLSTYIHLPPGPLPLVRVRDFFQLAFGEFCWFRPMRYGRAALDERVDPDDVDYAALLAYYEEHQTLTVTARTERDFLLLSPSKSEERPYIGWLTINTSATEARKSSWRAAHLRQVGRVMQLFGSPLAQTGLYEDIWHKQYRRIPASDGFGQEEVFTVRDYSEGLAGLFWRNVFGPPFVRMFGERLASLPSDTRQELGDGFVLVQPYELPTQAGTPEGNARERELIARLGPECFYDHERHAPPTQRPELPSRPPLG